MNSRLYVDEKQNVLTGKDAELKLAEHSDAKYLTQDSGIIRVDNNRWDLAQEYEKHYWLTRKTKATNDRNLDHAHEYEKVLRKEHILHGSDFSYDSVYFIGQRKRT